MAGKVQMAIHRLFNAHGDVWRLISKTLRYVRIYGLSRTWFKVAGRTRKLSFARKVLPARTVRRDVAMIGCGQFAFATIGYYLSRHFGRPFVECYDSSAQAAATFAQFYGVARPAPTGQAAIESPDVKIVYIASNHASHTPYSIAALQAGKTVYLEKPIAVSLGQLQELTAAMRTSRATIYAGYNRPFSKAVTTLREYCRGETGPLTLSCFVSGHKLGTKHWYRNAEEGTRICGNVGHWLDLAVHMLAWDELPDRWRIVVAWSNQTARDDDLAITLVSERGDLVNIVLTARSEPFEGINETINLQVGKLIAKIDDFRRMDVWQGAGHRRHRYWPKDVGHGAAILQPFRAAGRVWREIEFSTLLMLRIARMVNEGERQADFSFSAEAATLVAVTCSSTLQ